MNPSESEKTTHSHDTQAAPAGKEEIKNKDFFHYNTLTVNLDPETRSAIVSFKHEKLTLESLFELEGLSNWLIGHMEIHAVLLTSEHENFGLGFDQDELLKMNDERFYQTLERIQKLTCGFFYLPQTIIVDLKNGAQGICSELALGADMRIARRGCHVSFSVLNEGRVNTCGGIGLLELMVSPQYCRQWNLCDGPIPTDQLLASGFLYQLYAENESTAENLLKKIAKQSPIARIQAKRSLFEGIRSQVEKLREREFQFATAALGQRDWEEAFKAKKEKRSPQFKNPKELGQ